MKNEIGIINTNLVFFTIGLNSPKIYMIKDLKRYVIRVGKTQKVSGAINKNNKQLDQLADRKEGVQGSKIEKRLVIIIINLVYILRSLA